MPACAGNADKEDYLLKAAFVYKFALYTYWPEENKDTPLVFCSVGEDKLGDALAQLANKRVRGRPLKVMTIHDDSAPTACHLLYVAVSEKGSFRSHIATARKSPLLTISELHGFVEAGGIIEIGWRGERIYFDVNLTQARHSGLKMRSQLLRLARRVKSE